MAAIGAGLSGAGGSAGARPPGTFLPFPPAPTIGAFLPGSDAAVQPRTGQDHLVREQDRFLPIANVSRIMRRVLPPHAKVAKEAKEAVQEAVSELISFVTSEASDKCMQEKRKTINGDDVLWALATLGFEPYVDPLRLHLAKFRETVRIQSGELRAVQREEKERKGDVVGGGGAVVPDLG